jgi:hypothetical protein
MEAPPKVQDGSAEAHPGYQTMEHDDVVTLCAARVAAEVAIDERHTHGRIALVTAFVRRAPDLGPLATGAADEHSPLG